MFEEHLKHLDQTPSRFNKQAHQIKALATHQDSSKESLLKLEEVPDEKKENQSWHDEMRAQN